LIYLITWKLLAPRSKEMFGSWDNLTGGTHLVFKVKCNWQ